MLEIAHAFEVFVTAFYGVLHRPSGKLTYVRAGHEPPLLLRPGHAVETLTGEGRFLGLWPDLSLPEYHIRLRPGDRLVAYSDGVTDAVNSDGEQFGIARLRNSLETHGKLPASGMVQAIVEDVDNWCLDADPFDDLTLLGIEAI
jgi:serine phosphatase RsbU (regulator of sigma subunit)